jgi:hypothetical protein
MRWLITLSVVLLLVGGCRTVWLHEDWYEGKYEEDYADCREQAHTSRVRTVLRECHTDPETGDETCTESVTQERRRSAVNWKHCMKLKGWEPETGMRSRPVSEPKR